MKRHLTDDQLLQLAFNLADESQAEAIRAHLAQCADCRQRQEQLRTKFAALDVLRDDPQVTDKLVQQTLATLKTVKSTAATPWWRSKALAAAAAGIIILLAIPLFIPNLNKARKEIAQDVTTESAKSPTSPTADTYAGKSIAARESRDLPPSPSLASPGEESLAAANAMVAANAAEMKWQPEEPPFAPASNIELVTLPRRQSVQLTIYNAADLTLVREQRKLTLQKGWNWLQFMWANTLIDPTSLSLEPKEHTGDIDVEQLSFPPRLPAVGRWLIKSRVAGEVPFEITYFTSGLRWRAFYMGTLTQDETKMDLTGYVRVDNQTGEDYENAQVRLLVGKINLLDNIADLSQRENAFGRQIIEYLGQDGKTVSGDNLRKYRFLENNLYWADSTVRGISLAGDMDFMALKEIKKEGLSEYFLYSIEGTETIPNGWGKRLESFEAKDIPVESLYKFDRERWGNDARCFLTFTNDEDHKLGETPIPDGMMRIYRRANEQGRLSYVGGCDIKYIPVGEEVELDLGAAQQVKVEPVLMAYATDDYDFGRKGDIAGWSETNAWTVKLTNARPLPVKVRFEHAMSSPYWKLTDRQGEGDYEAWDATHLRFTQTIAPRTQKEFSFTTEELYGTKREKSATDSPDEH